MREPKKASWRRRVEQVKWPRFSIATRVHAAFAVLLLTVLALGMISLGLLAKMNREAFATRNDWLPSAVALGQLHTLLRQYRADEAGMLLAGGSEEITAARARVALAAAGVRQARTSAEPLISPGLDDARYMRDFDRAWAAYHASSARIGAEIGRASPAQLRSRFLDDDLRNYAAAISALDADIIYNSRQGIAAENAAIHAYAVTRRLIMGTFLMALLMSAALGATLARAIVQPVRRMSGVLQDLAAHRYQVTIPGIERRDELGHMANALENLRGRLKENDRLHAEQDAQRAALQEIQARFRTIFDSVSEAIFVGDPDTGAFLEVNPAACALTGYGREELVARDAISVFSGRAPYDLRASLTWILRARRRGPQTFEWRARARDGRLFWTEVSIRFTRFGARDVVLATVRDIDERKQAEERIQRLACTDALTGLANRVVFIEAVSQAIARARRGARSFAVLSVDLDHFKEVNDTLGHPAGDELLRAVAGRLRGAIRDTDVVARFGGDEFAVLALEIGGADDAAAMAAKLLEVLGRPVTISARELQVGASIGIAMYQSAAEEVETLLSRADVALYRAKRERRGCYRF